jgi:hypothetical protein
MVMALPLSAFRIHAVDFSTKVTWSSRKCLITDHGTGTALAR